MEFKILMTFILLISLAFAAFPNPVGYVNDFANVLANTAKLENELRLYEQNTTVEIAVVTIRELPPDHTLATYAVELFNEWKIGKKAEDNGILIIFVENGTRSNRMRIELGYGTQGYITGAEAGRMLDRALPFYEIGDYQKAAEIILADISGQLVDYSPENVRERRSGNTGLFLELIFVILSNFPFLIFIIVFIVSIALSNRCPYCIKGKIMCEGDYCFCKRCGRKFTKRKRYAPFLVGGSRGFHGGSGGFGGFGGGSSGGGGAGR